jgi:hypothetical protein
MGYPSVFPTSTTIYYPDRCFSGYTVYSSTWGEPILIDMNGNIVNRWKGLAGFPPKILPGGFVMASTGVRNPKYGYQDGLDLVQVDWSGNVVWKFSKYQRIKDGRQKAKWMARVHHDFQREGNPVGYYAPGLDPKISGGNTTLLCHKNLKQTDISEKPLQDDSIIEVTWDGKIVWEWVYSDHVEEMGFAEDAKNIMHRNPNMVAASGGVGDWMHSNSMALLGPNKWYDEGDERFHPDNVIWDGRQTNVIAIVDKKSGKIVWQLGPDYEAREELRKLGWIIGQHHVHLIPKGLPGEGNLLIFDNGGWAGYGSPNPGAPTGLNHARRDFSRVLELNPQTLEVVWQYTPAEAGFVPLVEDSKFYSTLVSSAQRLPNGNTLITEGCDGRLFEVTSEHEIVWEYINPFIDRKREHNLVYRAYRVPYEWIPQLDKPDEVEVPRLDNSKFRVLDAPGERAVVTRLKRGGRVNPDPALCVIPTSR